MINIVLQNIKTEKLLDVIREGVKVDKTNSRMSMFIYNDNTTKLIFQNTDTTVTKKFDLITSDFFDVVMPDDNKEQPECMRFVKDNMAQWAIFIKDIFTNKDMLLEYDENTTFIDVINFIDSDTTKVTRMARNYSKNDIVEYEDIDVENVMFDITGVPQFYIDVVSTKALCDTAKYKLDKDDTMNMVSFIHNDNDTDKFYNQVSITDTTTSQYISTTKTHFNQVDLSKDFLQFISPNNYTVGIKDDVYNNIIFVSDSGDSGVKTTITLKLATDITASNETMQDNQQSLAWNEIFMNE